ncbi:uncharacterized protein V1516DRAFT_467999 [Lipomyces oligophaga]|uniref:uncharacterized protein n=1 Tax=Lipomyces oligophaga TaxID=45792 RepID=UPI0034CE4AB3
MAYQYHTYSQQQQAPGQLQSISSLHQSRARFDAGRVFDVEDDLEFCPTLSEEEIQSATPYSSDRSSTSGSPESSPLQHQIRPASMIYGQVSPGVSPVRSALSRTRRAIEIVDPATGMRVSSPPLSTPSKMNFFPVGVPASLGPVAVNSSIHRRPW